MGNYKASKHLNITTPKNIHLLYILIIFNIMFLFFTQIHPIILTDPDDWTYISFIRQAIPLHEQWNPAKIFPETFMGLLGYIAAFIVYPITQKYILSFTLVYGFAIAISISLYLYAFDKLISDLFSLSIKYIIPISIFFFSAHFLVFKTNSENNIYMFEASNINCYMNYVIPFTICAILSMQIIKYNLNNYYQNTNNFIKGLLILILYLAIFSNMVDNILLVSIVFIDFIYNIDFHNIKTFLTKDMILKKFGLYIYIFILELICLFYEATGERSNSLPFDFYTQLKETVEDIHIIYQQINKQFLLFSIFLILTASILMIKKKDFKNFNLIIKLLLCFIICLLYTILLMIRVGYHKMQRPENIAVIFFYVALLSGYCLAYILKQYKKLYILTPLATYILIIFCVSNGEIGHIYRGNNNIDYRLSVNEIIIQQLVDADKKGENKIMLHVDSAIGIYEWGGAKSC